MAILIHSNPQNWQRIRIIAENYIGRNLDDAGAEAGWEFYFRILDNRREISRNNSRDVGHSKMDGNGCGVPTVTIGQWGDRSQ